MVSTTRLNDYTELAGEYDSERYVDEYDAFMDGLRERKLVELLAPDDTMHILDVGTGTGSGVMYCAKKVAQMTALDGTQAMLDKARVKMDEAKIENAELVHANALEIPRPDGSFDAVISLNFVHLFTPAKSQRPFLDEMERVAKKGARVIVEIDNAFLGFGLGIFRKYFVKDIGYNWPWDPARMSGMKVERVVGVSLPATKRLARISKGLATAYSKLATAFPLKYFANRLLIQYRKP